MSIFMFLYSALVALLLYYNVTIISYIVTYDPLGFEPKWHTTLCHLRKIAQISKKLM
jgi:hypothetical protein